MKTIVLKPGREKSVLQRHPWIFSGAIENVEGDPLSGDTVLVCSHHHQALGWAAYSPASNIRARMWTWNPDEAVDEGFFRRKLTAAKRLRQQVVSPDETNAYRLIYAESDGLPGLIVDRYEDYLVTQFLSAGPDAQRDLLIHLLAELTGVQNIYERSDVDVRRLEGLPERRGVLLGNPPPDLLQIQENGLKFWTNLKTGHKTGFYIDQRLNRQALRQKIQAGEALNCFSYTGAFSVYALAGGAQSVLSVDSSKEALELGEKNLALNGFLPQKAEWLEGDVFLTLRQLRDAARSFDTIILDPPKFAPTAAQAERAARGYKDINLLAFKLLRPGGALFTFSCSGGVSAELFQKIVAGAALDAGVIARVVGVLSQGPDHPVALNFPEGAYLKGLICKV